MEYQYITGATLMKKKVIGFAVFGTILAIIGGVGSAINFPKAEKQTKTAINERYKIKQNNKNLTIALKGNINYYVYESEDQDIHISGEAHSVVGKQSFTWKPSETGDKTLIDVTFTETDDYRNFIQLGFSQYVNIAIPSSFESITVNSSKNSQVDISDLKTTDLVFNTDQHRYSSLENLRLDSLTVNAKSGSVDLTDITVQETLNLKGDQGSLTINNSRAKLFDIQNADGYISLNKLIGDTTIKTDSGIISLNDLKGKVSAVTIDGNIDWDYGKLTDNLDFKTTSGDIRINLETRPNNFNITTKTKNGSVSLFGKEQNKLKKGTGDPTLTLESLHGDIRVYDEDTEYKDYDDEDFDEAIDEIL